MNPIKAKLMSSAYSTNSAGIMFTMLIFMLNTIVSVNAFPLFEVDDYGDTLNEVTNNTITPGRQYYIGNNTYIVNVTAVSPANDTARLVKREIWKGDYYCQDYNCEWVQVQRARSGTWWTDWRDISGCLDSGLGSGGSYTRQICDSKTWSVTAGGGIEFGAIKLTADYTVSKTHEQCESWTCTVNPNSYLSMWSQSKMYWADLQKQSCNDYSGSTSCGSFGGYIRVNAPISDNHADNYNVGCSTGKASGCSDS